MVGQQMFVLLLLLMSVIVISAIAAIYRLFVCDTWEWYQYDAVTPLLFLLLVLLLLSSQIIVPLSVYY